MVVFAAMVIALAGPARPANAANEPPPLPDIAHAKAPVDTALAARILALDPVHISDLDVREILANAPAPRIIALSGSLGLVTMEPFARFLAAMGYPEERIRDPANGEWSYSSFGDSTALAGTLAWHYEREGMVPMLIGHSHGGMLMLRTLHELAGAFGDTIPVWNPLTGEALARSTIADPVTGKERPVVGLKVGYATALATGKLPRLLLGQWTMLTKLRRVPDSVDEFTGFAIEWDLIAGNFPGAEPYAATGSATVRNVTLPASYSHIGLPRTQHLAANEATRAWINEYSPGANAAALPGDGAIDVANIIHAADIWHSVKKHWCLEAQRRIRAANNG
jgi:hypothetical protein